MSGTGQRSERGLSETSPYWNRRVRGLAPYTPGEQPRDRRYIKLNTNESPYPPSPKVLEAIREAANGDLRLYPDPTCLALRSTIAVRYGLPGPEWVFVGNGSDEILAFAFAAFFGPRDGEARTGDARPDNAPTGNAPTGNARPGEARPGNARTGDARPGDTRTDNARPLLFPDITYSFYPVYGDLWGISYRTIPVSEEFQIDVADYRQGACGVVLANPNAPTGRALGKGALTDLVAYHQQEGNVVILDEAYVDFGAESMADQVPRYDNLLVVHTLSKSRSLAGLRVGYALGNPDLIEGLRRIKDSLNSYTLDRLALAGAAAAIQDRAYYDEMAGRIIKTREWTIGRLTALGFEVVPSKANFIFVRHPARRGQELFQALRDRGILVRHWNRDRICDYLRVTIGTDDEMATLTRVCGEILAVP